MKLALHVLLLLSYLADATQFYPYGNPCNADPMYYEDAVDVTADLSSFKALYIKYEGCAYSNRVDIQSDDANSGNDKWYLGFAYKQGGNVAFSLYGEKDDQKGSKCSKKTFINSFYTNDGLTAFATAAGINLSNHYAYTNYNRQLGGDNNNNRQYNNNQNNANGGNKNNNNGQTQGLYCNPTTMQFEEAIFTDKSMNPQYYSSTVDTLETLNKAMSKISCVQIYNRNTGENYASSLLTYSDSCLTSDGTQCPDRYGKLATCEEKFMKNDGYLMISNNKVNAENIRYLVGGLFLVASAIVVLVHIKMQRDPSFVASCTLKGRKSEFEVDGGGRKKSRSKKDRSSSRRSKSKRRSKMDDIRADDAGQFVGDVPEHRMT